MLEMKVKKIEPETIRKTFQKDPLFQIVDRALWGYKYSHQGNMEEYRCTEKDEFSSKPNKRNIWYVETGHFIQRNREELSNFHLVTDVYDANLRFTIRYLMKNRLSKELKHVAIRLDIERVCSGTELYGKERFFENNQFMGDSFILLEREEEAPTASLSISNANKNDFA